MKLTDFLYAYTSGRKVLLLFVVTNFVYLAILFYTIPAVTEQAPEMKLFDMSPYGYSYEYTKDFLSAIGPAGRTAYLRLQLLADSIYPGLFAFTYTLMLFWIFKKSYSLESKMFILAFVPAAAGIFDYLENAGIVVMLRAYPSLSPGIVRVTSMFSVLKSFLTVVFYLLLLYGFTVYIVERTRRRRERRE